jgi:phospholipid/cholesterol/gamma-HCH transport system permease protein
MKQDNEIDYFLMPERLTIENISPLFKEIKKAAKKNTLQLDFREVKELDSSAIALVNFLKRLDTDISFSNLSPAIEKQFAMFPVAAKPVIQESKESGLVRKHLENMGERFLHFKKELKDFLTLLTDEIYYTYQFILKRRGVYPGETWNQLFFMAYKSFPIVTLISFLVGVTISITSAEQLRNFGADIYLADLVGFGMIRELVPLMTGIILAGKIGASVTAEIASMKVLEETDALKTMGIIPEKFLMVPRLMAITIAIPLLVAIADCVGIFAGVLVARTFSGIPPAMFFSEMFTVVGVSDFLIGMGKTMVFGWLVIIGSGYKGFSVKRGATGVGVSTTESVVLSISLIIIFDCIFAFFLY